MIKANAPIGIFDSGIGGLTVANAISKHLPNEKFIYFGDTAHLPYGDKSPDSIKYYSIRIAQFLLDSKCKAIVIACNTASAIAYETVKSFVGKKAIVINVIDPVVEHVANYPKIEKVGVIGTKATIKTNVYASKLNTLNQQLKVASLATPLLAPMIEEGFFNNKISRTVIHSYLSSAKLKKIDALILACTHYPLIKNEVAEYYKKDVKIIDSADVVAQYTKHILSYHKLLNSVTSNKQKKHRFFVSDYTESFEKSAKHFFKDKIQLEEADIWK